MFDAGMVWCIAMLAMALGIGIGAFFGAQAGEIIAYERARTTITRIKNRYTLWDARDRDDGLRLVD